MEILYYILAVAAGMALGYVITVAVQKSLARNRAKTILEEAQREAEVLKKNKVLEAREEELKIKAEAEKQALLQNPVDGGQNQAARASAQPAAERKPARQE